MTSLVARPRRLPTAVRLGLRDLRHGLKGFGVFLACIALGVAAIAGVGSFARGLVEGLSREGQAILGADISFQVMHQETSPEALAFLRSRGEVATMATTRAMARDEAGRSTLVELKAVEPDAYPLFGALDTEPPIAVPDALARRGGRFGVLVDQALLTRLDRRVGDPLILGDITVTVTGVIRQEPDRLAAGIGFGPRLLIALPAFRETGLIQPGSLIRWLYQVKLEGRRSSDGDVGRLAADMRTRFPEGGFDVRTRMNASPQLAAQVLRFSQFLTLVGLTALLVGGVGVANAVASLLDRKRDDIATLKALGATGGTIFGATLTHVGGLAVIGTVVGLTVGVALPYAVIAAFGAAIPVPVAAGFYADEIALAGAYGLLVALAFAIWPLARAHDIPVSALFRDTVDGVRRLPRKRYRWLTGGILAALAVLAVAASFNPRLALGFMAGAAAMFLVLRLLGSAVMAIARRLPRPRATGARLALANLHRPGALTPAVVLSLGLGLTLLVVIALIDASFRRQIEQTLPARAPSFFFVDIPNAEVDRFEQFVAREAPGAALDRVPMLRGRFVALGGRPVEEIRAADDIRWALSGDRGITYSDVVPRNSRLAEGEWWPRDYAGPPLVSFDARMGRGFGLSVGDLVTVNVLGRNISARIANFRHVQWDTLGINFIVVFSSNTFRAAPHSHLATLTAPPDFTGADEAALQQKLAAAFPSVTTVRVKDALEAVGTLAAQLAAGIRGASAITLMASILVLAGALAAGHRARVYDAVILKTLGAGRPLLMAAYALEYAVLGVVAALFAIAAGAAAAWVVTTQVMSIPLAFPLESALGVLGFAVALTVGFGLLGTWRALGEKPATVLRNM